MFEGSQHHDKGYFQPLQGAGALAERIDQRRSHQLLGSGADQRARARAVDGIRPHGLSAAGADRGEVLEPARRRAERAAPELREPARTASRRWRCWRRSFRPIIRITGRRSARSPICTRRSVDEVRAVLQHLLPPGERVARASPATSTPTTALELVARYFEEICRRARRSRRCGPRTPALQRRNAAAARGSRRAAAPVSRLAHAGDVRRRRRRARSRGRHPRQRQDVAALSPAGLREAHRHRRVGGAELARSRRLRAGRRDRRARPHARRARTRHRRGDRAGSRPKGRPSDEIERGRVQAEAQFVFRLQTVGGFGGKSDQLNAYNVFLERSRLLRPRSGALPRRHARSRCARRCAAISRTSIAWRSASCRRARRCSRCPARSRRWFHESVRHDRRSQPAARVPGRRRPFHFPAIEKSTLPNGLRVWTVRHASIPVVTVMLLSAAARPTIRRAGKGWPRSPPTCSTRAAATLSAIEMHEALARLGAQLDSDIGPDATLLTVTVLSRFVEPALVAARRHRRAPVAARRRLRARAPAAAAPADAAARHAGRGRRSRVRAAALRQHPYGHTPLGSEQSLSALTVDDVRALPRGEHPAGRRDAGGGRRLRPRGRSQRLPREAFGGWNGAATSPLPVAPPLPGPPRLNIIPRPGAPQSELRIGHVAVARNTPDYHALVAANMVLGGQFVSRINLNLREEKGFTYGARTSFDFRRLPGPVLAAGQRADGGDRRGDPRIAGRDRRHPRSAPGDGRGAGARRRGADARLRAQLRDRRAGRARGHAARALRSAGRLLRRVRPDASSASRSTT